MAPLKFRQQRKPIVFERRGDKLISWRLFLRRIAKCLSWATLIVVASLLVGASGYHFTESLPWLDSALNASMILGGMGPVDTIKTDGGKIFASLYALYSGLVLIGMIGLLLAPVFHRIIHSFHQPPE
jgi:hypothetical protein